ncbi:MAG: alpha/beta fold hydrolase [Actinomycetota bacterium]
MNYEVRGNPDGPTLLLVHGFLSSNVQWDLNVDRLGAQLRLVLVELLGHGDSPAPDDAEAYRVESMNASFEGIREAVGVDRWWVCGQSLGAAMSLRYVLANQDRVRGVVVTNTRAAFGHTRNDPNLVDYTDYNLRDLPVHPIHARRFPDDIKARMVERADRIPAHALNHTVVNRATWRSVDELHQLTMPVMLVNGRYERAFQPFVDDVRHALPTIEIVHLEGGHSINVEQPEAFDAAVLDFVTRHR